MGIAHDPWAQASFFLLPHTPVCSNYIGQFLLHAHLTFDELESAQK